MLVYTNVLTTSFQDGETITGGTSGATAKVVNVQAEPKRIYFVNKSGTFQSSETVTGGTSGATATLTSGTATVNQSGRILVTTFATIPDAGDSLQFATTDGNAYQIQSISTVTISSVAYRVIVFSTSRATAVAENVLVNVRKEFSLVRLTGHDFLQVGTGGTDTTNWPNNPTQDPNQTYQVMTNETDPGRVYYTATDDLGNFYVGDQFKVDQATGNVTLDASAFNLSGLESLRLGSVGGLIGASINEFSTDATLGQNSNNKVPTQAAVKGYVDTVNDITPTGGTLGVVGILTANSAVFAGNISVGGVLTYEDVTNVDSVGIITARTGIKVLGGGVSAVGIITADSYRGDGSQLTGIDATSLKDPGGSTKIQAQASGLMITGITTVSGNFMPGTDNNLDLGSLTQRWANVYVGDMNLSNKGKKNDVDGTWGNFTLQEGENDLFIINNRSGKRYKFNLTEIPLGDD